MDVLQPTGLADALSAIAEEPGALVLAGGTDLMVTVNEGLRAVDRVVALRSVPELRGVDVADDEVVVGAGVTYTDLMAGEVATAAPALAHAARTVGSPQIRNAGTLGGNLGTASPAGDTLPVLVALGAAVDVVGPTGTRTVPVADFLVGPKCTALGPAELITAVRVPRRRGPQDYLKVGVRNAMVISVASLAFVMDLDARTVTVGLGSVGPTALAAPDACAWIADRLVWSDAGAELRSAGDAGEFGARVAAACAPIDDHRSTAAYRRHAVGVLATRALARSCAAIDTGMAA